MQNIPLLSFYFKLFSKYKIINQKTNLEIHFHKNKRKQDETI